MKKLLSTILALALLALCMPCAFAEDTQRSETEKVLSSVLERIPDTSAYKKFEANRFESENGRISFNFSWYNEDEGDSASMYVTALADGTVLGFSVYGGEKDYTPATDKISTDAALVKARELVKKLNPGVSEKFVVENNEDYDSLYTNEHVFSVLHIENGIPVKGDEGSVTLDAKCEKITDFSISYTTSVTYPKSNIISEDKAKAAFKEKIGMEHIYRTYFDWKTKKTTVFPVYAMPNSDVYIDAVTGEKTQINDDRYITYKGYMKEAAMDSNSGGGSRSFSEAETAELENIEGLLSVKDIEARLRANKLFGLDYGYELTYTDARKNVRTEKDEYLYYMTFRKKDGNGYKYAYVTVNAANGEIKDFSRDQNGENITFPSDETAKKTAESIISSLAPEKGGEYKLDTVSDGYVTYDRYVSGIRVSGDFIRISLYGKGAELTTYAISYTDAEFPEITNAIDKDKAADIMFGETAYSAMYIPYAKSADSISPDHCALCYVPEDSSVMINSLSGKRVRYDAKPYSSGKLGEYADIESHYAKGSINELKRFGIGFGGGQFKPDEPILQKDFAALLVTADNRSSIVIDENTDYDDFYRQARWSLIKKDEASPDSYVTRLDAAKYICRALSIEKCAELEGIYNCPFVDVTSGKGYTTLLWGLKILSGEGGGTFSPDAPLTRGDCAIMLSRMLSLR